MIVLISLTQILLSYINDNAKEEPQHSNNVSDSNTNGAAIVWSSLIGFLPFIFINY